MLFRQLHRVFAGLDGPERRALPVGEFLHPIPLLAVAILAINDWFLKGSVAPSELTGKLSDFAGLLFFPLLLTSCVNTILLAAFRLGARVNFSLTLVQLRVSCIITAVVFSATKLSQPIADTAARFLGCVGLPSRIVADPTDLVSLISIAGAYALGRRELARVPLGRLEVLERMWRVQQSPPHKHLGDVVACGAPVTGVDNLSSGLIEYYQSGDATNASAALATIRGGSVSKHRGSRN